MNWQRITGWAARRWCGRRQVRAEPGWPGPVASRASGQGEDGRSVGRPRYARVLGDPNERRELGTVGNVEKAMMRRYGRDAPALRRARMRTAWDRVTGNFRRAVGELLTTHRPVSCCLREIDRGRWRPASPTDGCPAVAPPSRRLAFRRAFPTHRMCDEQTLPGRCPLSPRPLDQRAFGCRIVAFLRGFGAREVVLGVAAVGWAPRGGEQPGLAVHY